MKLKIYHCENCGEEMIAGNESAIICYCGTEMEAVGYFTQDFLEVMKGGKNKHGTRDN